MYPQQIQYSPTFKTIFRNMFFPLLPPGRTFLASILPALSEQIPSSLCPVSSQ